MAGAYAGCMAAVAADGRSNANCNVQGSSSGYMFRIGSAGQATYYSACHWAPVNNPNPIILYGSCLPPVVCPALGEGFTTHLDVTFDDSGASILGGFKTYQGCQMQPVHESVDCDWDPNGSGKLECRREIGYEFTGNEAQSDEVDVEGDDQPTLQEPLSNHLPDGDYTSDGSTTDESLPTSITLGDGTVIENGSLSYIEFSGSGVTITTAPPLKTITSSEGLVQSTQTTTTTTTAPDGSKTVVTDTTITYEQHPKNSITLDSSNGTSNKGTQSGFSGGRSSSTTDTYNATGTQTGSSTTNTGGTGSGEGEPGEEGGVCDEMPNSPDCKTYAGADDGGIYTPGELNMGDVMGGFTSRIEGSALMNATSGFYTITASASCPIWTTSIWFTTITVDQQCLPWFLSVLYIVSKLMLAVASFYAFRIALL
ncbi:MAG: hypothetical protein HRT73_05705 [Flavobacteriales bacterium]|nr:hypothetical protein [Flavobacteriales bacterium]